MAAATACAVAAVGALRASAPGARALSLRGMRQANIPPVRTEQMHSPIKK